MKVVILLLALTLGLCEARKCYKCEGTGREACPPVAPGGSLNAEEETCSKSNALCKLRSVNGKIDMRDCSDKTELSVDYKAVEGDSKRKCGMLYAPTGEPLKECLCEGDFCNTSNPSALASLTLITSLLITKAIFM